MKIYCFSLRKKIDSKVCKSYKHKDCLKCQYKVTEARTEEAVPLTLKQKKLIERYGASEQKFFKLAKGLEINIPHFLKALERDDRIRQMQGKKTSELTEFVNFDFAIKEFKSTTGDKGYSINWLEYHNYLKNLDEAGCLVRPYPVNIYSDRYGSTHDRSLHNELLTHQAYLKDIASSIVRGERLTRSTLIEIFNHVENVHYTVSNVGDGFKRYLKAKDYVDILYWELSGIILDKMQWSIKQCVECDRFFISKTKRKQSFCLDSCRLDYHSKVRIKNGHHAKYMKKKRGEGKYQ